MKLIALNDCVLYRKGSDALDVKAGTAFDAMALEDFGVWVLFTDENPGEVSINDPNWKVEENDSD